MLGKSLNALIALVSLLLFSCNSNLSKHENISSLNHLTSNSESLLMDVSIAAFDSGITISITEDNQSLLDIRNAESIYIPHNLKQAIINTEKWGMVRLLPSQHYKSDVLINGEILHSDAEKLALMISVNDSSGKIWYKKKYEASAEPEKYSEHLNVFQEPFEKIYPEIAQDLLEYRERINSNEIKKIRAISELKDAYSFAPQVFEKYLEYDRSGKVRIKHLPSKSDPNILRVRKIQNRNDMFLDTLQLFYDSFVSKMQEPYFNWRKETYNEKLILLKISKHSRGQMANGALVILSSLIPFSKNNFLSIYRNRNPEIPKKDNEMPKTDSVGIAAGTELIEEGLDKLEQAKIHKIEIEELGNSLASSMAPILISVENDIVSLSGSVEEQFSQFQDILQKIYTTEFDN